jgi:hypothetical protein
MHKAWKAFPLQLDQPGVVFLNLAERTSLLRTLLKTIDNPVGNPTATQIMAELDSISKHPEANLVNPNAPQP